MPAYDADDHDDNPAEGGERVAKALARAGVASRREVERLIEGGRVAINGEVLTTPAVKVGPGDILTVDGEVIGDAEPTRVFRYHKPVGLMTSHNDPQGRPTVFESLPPGLPRLISVGRLDLNSEGLLLLTNDGALSRALELPSSGWPRTYRARAFGNATQEKLDALKAGVTVEGVKYGPIEARLDKAKDGTQGRNVWITVTLTEGKNREVRRVLESLGLKVNRLLRLAYGPFVLGDLAVGGVEEVGPRVIREQLEGLVSPQNMPKGDRPQYSGTGQGKAPGRRAQTPSKLALRAEGAARAAQKPAAEEKPKTEYKPGWARPKARPSGHAPAKAKRSDKPRFELERPTYKAGEPSRGADRRHRTGRVFARADDQLPGAAPRGPVRAGKAVLEAAAKGAQRDAAKAPGKSRPKGDFKNDFKGGDRRGPPSRGPGGKSFDRAEAPRADRPQSDRAQPARTASTRPHGDRPREDRPRDARPREAHPRDERPASARPRPERPMGERPKRVEGEAAAPRRDDGKRPPGKGGFKGGGFAKGGASRDGGRPASKPPGGFKGAPRGGPRGGPKGPPRG